MDSLTPQKQTHKILPLIEWQRAVVPALRQARHLPPCRLDVTALAYFFWDDDRIDSLFFTIEAAFGMTWRCCGHLPSRLVTNRATPQISRFCDENEVFLDVDATLTGGVPRMNLDCIEHLHRRFDTDFAFIIQSDGFPLRPGLPEFVGPYDYIGAPWPPPSWYTRLLFPYPRYSVGNGGLTIRSLDLCERASWHYRHRYKRLPYGYFLVDDVFYARVLPRFERTYRHDMRFAPPEVAANFAFEANEALLATAAGLPFGFHSAPAFLRLQTLFPDAFPKSN